MACVKLYTIGHFPQGFLYRYPGTCTPVPWHLYGHPHALPVANGIDLPTCLRLG